MPYLCHARQLTIEIVLDFLGYIRGLRRDERCAGIFSENFYRQRKGCGAIYFKTGIERDEQKGR